MRRRFPNIKSKTTFGFAKIVRATAGRKNSGKNAALTSGLQNRLLAESGNLSGYQFLERVVELFTKNSSPEPRSEYRRIISRGGSFMALHETYPKELRKKQLKRHLQVISAPASTPAQISYKHPASSLNLSNVNISFPQTPSRRSELISQFSVISRIVTKGAKQEDFIAEYEREIARRFSDLKTDKQTELFDELKQQMASH
jgi:hypothetical protein